MKTVLCYGDSNTHGSKPMRELGGGARYDHTIRWPAQLQFLLGSGYQIIDEGLPGRTTVHNDPVEGDFMNGLAVLPAILRSHQPLDLVLIMLGTNDLKNRFGVNEIDIALSLFKYGEIIKNSQTSPHHLSPHILFICPPPIIQTGCLGDMFSGGVETSIKMQKSIPDQLKRGGFDCYCAGDVIAVSALDGIHYESAAHKTLARALEPKIRSYC